MSFRTDVVSKHRRAAAAAIALLTLVGAMLATSPQVVGAASTATATFQETSSRIHYTGTWGVAVNSGYEGGHARYSRARGSSASITVTGIGFKWIGPSGPTRGSAKIYVNGAYVRTVSTYSSQFVAKRVLFAISWATQRSRTIKIVVSGTPGRPTIAIDALRVVSVVPSTSTSGRTVSVSSISDLKAALADNTVGLIVVRDGTYRISPSADKASNSLWIGEAYAGRTQPVTVRAATIGGVTFDGGGASGFRALSFEAGAHDQTWEGFNFGNMAAYNSGIIEIAGYTSRAAPYRITLRNITILSSCRGRATTANGNTFDHGVYISQALSPGAHDIVFEDFSVHGEGGLATAFHFFHGADNGGVNAHNVTVRGLTVTGTQQAFLIWEPTVYNVTLDSSRISNAKAYAIRYETIGSQMPYGIRITNTTSSGSGYQGFFSSLGSHPPGVTFSNDSLN